DIEGLYGRFHEGDTQLLGVLAAQAALTLANVRASEGLERKVEQRTSELATSTAQAEQRAAELAVISSIQQGIAGSLDFKGIVELVGERLREAFAASCLVICWFDQDAGLIHFLYGVEHGKRLHLPPARIADYMTGRRFYDMLRAREPVLWH